MSTRSNSPNSDVGIVYNGLHDHVRDVHSSRKPVFLSEREEEMTLLLFWWIFLSLDLISCGIDISIPNNAELLMELKRTQQLQRQSSSDSLVLPEPDTPAHFLHGKEPYHIYIVIVITYCVLCSICSIALFSAFLSGFSFQPSGRDYWEDKSTLSIAEEMSQDWDDMIFVRVHWIWREPNRRNPTRWFLVYWPGITVLQY